MNLLLSPNTFLKHSPRNTSLDSSSPSPVSCFSCPPTFPTFRSQRKHTPNSLPFSCDYSLSSVSQFRVPSHSHTMHLIHPPIPPIKSNPLSFHPTPPFFHIRIVFFKASDQYHSWTALSCYYNTTMRLILSRSCERFHHNGALIFFP